jgi:hypothetical protein
MGLAAKDNRAPLLPLSNAMRHIGIGDGKAV